MNSGEQAKPDHQGEMGAGGELYAGLEAREVGYDDVTAAIAETEKYRELARLAREGGDTLLADRLAKYTEDLSATAHEEFIKAQIYNGWRDFQELTRQDKGHVDLAIGFDDGPSSQEVLAPLRKMLLGDIDLEEIGATQTETGELIYAVPMQDRMRYVETRDAEISPRGGRLVTIEVFKDPPPQ